MRSITCVRASVSLGLKYHLCKSFSITGVASMSLKRSNVHIGLCCHKKSTNGVIINGHQNFSLKYLMHHKYMFMVFTIDICQKAM